ncbi:MAG: biotin/lipoyl-containing protein [Ktedonobacteraceae bacterium]|nr:hypothetical protein [Chloroflexota bacterium]
MDTHEQKAPWLARVEEIINVLEGSSIGELELTEGDTEIIIRRQPGMVLVTVPTQQLGQVGMTLASGSGARMAKEDHSLPIMTPITGVFYSSPSPAEPPFVSLGDIVQVGQVVALIEAMKVFNEIQAEVGGCVTEVIAVNGNVVQKGDALLRVEPA